MEVVGREVRRSVRVRAVFWIERYLCGYLGF